MKVRKKHIYLTFLVIIMLYWFSIIMFYIGEGKQLFYRDAETPSLDVNGDIVSEELSKDFDVNYVFKPNIDIIDSLTFKFATWGHDGATINISIIDKNSNVIFKTSYLCSEIPDSQALVVNIPDNQLQNMYNEELNIHIYSDAAASGESAAVWINSLNKQDGSQLYYNGKRTDGGLSLKCTGRNIVWLGNVYWQLSGITFGVLFLVLAYIALRVFKGKKNIIVSTLDALNKYMFLIKQLVSRDFKTKYKKSVLGVLWSFINPLLAMTIQYLVFSHIFKNDIKNYPVYLLSGYTIFNFFSEAVNLAIESIVGNVALITKVYVPKYIYPFTRVCSSAINLLISMFLLIIMCVIMKIPFSKSLILIPFPIICIFLFTLGVGLLLANMMVFFRDVKFLWGAISLVWMYATPIFYPASIIPDKYRLILDLNPISSILELFRAILIQGQGAEPKLFVLCFVYSVGAFVLGTWAFKKKQDDFVLYL